MVRETVGVYLVHGPITYAVRPSHMSALPHPTWVAFDEHNRAAKLCGGVRKAAVKALPEKFLAGFRPIISSRIDHTNVET
jgi:hypothetical protein